MTKTISAIFIAAILLTSTVAINTPAVFADDKEKMTKLVKECSKELKKPEKIKPHCELVNIINSLQEDQTTKNAQIDALIAQLQVKDVLLMAKDDLLMDKDTELMDKDMALMDKDMQLMSDLSSLTQEVVKVCKNIPGFNLIFFSLLTFFDGARGTFFALDKGLDFVKDIDISFTVPIKNPKFKIPDPELHTKTITILSIDFPIPTSFHVHAKNITFDIPDPTINLGPIFAEIAPVLLPTAEGFDEAFDALSRINECDTGKLPT